MLLSTSIRLPVLVLKNGKLLLAGIEIFESLIGDFDSHFSTNIFRFVELLTITLTCFLDLSAVKTFASKNALLLAEIFVGVTDDT